jgi:Protein of unknown function (DUF3421)
MWSKFSDAADVETCGIFAGEENGRKIYVGRSIDVDGNLVPSKLVPSMKKSFFCYQDKEDSSDIGEFLSNPNEYSWTSSKSADFQNAAKIGNSFIGRAYYEGKVVVGQVDAQSGQLIGCYEGKSLRLPSYDLLTHQASSNYFQIMSFIFFDEKFHSLHRHEHEPKKLHEFNDH